MACSKINYSPFGSWPGSYISASVCWCALHSISSLHGAIMLIPSSVYFGGSRSQSITQENHLAVLRAVANSSQVVHVGCQLGVDQSVVSYFGMFAPSSLVVFAVAPNKAQAPRHVQQISGNFGRHAGMRVIFNAGGSVAPIPARYLLRSIAAFQGCESAVFFSPGPGSLAVARECIKSGLPVFAFGAYPAPIPSSVGFWVEQAFMGFACWQWQVTVTQPSLF